LIVFIKFLGYFSQITGKREEKIVLKDGSTLGDLVEFLVRKYGRNFERAISGEGYRQALFVVNGRRAEEDQVLSHGDEVVISYPIGGGFQRA